MHDVIANVSNAQFDPFGNSSNQLNAQSKGVFLRNTVTKIAHSPNLRRELQFGNEPLKQFKFASHDLFLRRFHAKEVRAVDLRKLPLFA